MGISIDNQFDFVYQEANTCVLKYKPSQMILEDIKLLETIHSGRNSEETARIFNRLKVDFKSKETLSIEDYEHKRESEEVELVHNDSVVFIYKSRKSIVEIARVHMVQMSTVRLIKQGKIYAHITKYL